MQTFCDLNKYSLLLRRFTFKTHINIIKSKNKSKNMEESTATVKIDAELLKEIKIYCVQKSLKLKEVFELALKEYKERHLS